MNKQITISLDTLATNHKWIFNEILTLVQDHPKFQLTGIWVNDKEEELKDEDNE